jgi:hypothetical protein
MVPIHEFVMTLAVAGKIFKDIQQIVQIVRDPYGNKAIKRTQI